MESLQEIYKQLKNLGFTLEKFHESDEGGLYEIFRSVIDADNQFPYECNSFQEFHRRFFGDQQQVYVCHAANNEVVGGFYLRANFSGRSSHIANAAYMVRDEYRGGGVGTLLVKASLSIAKELGFRAMLFNMVLNQKAIKLYQKLGFKVIGTIPEAVRSRDGSYLDGHLMYIKLD